MSATKADWDDVVCDAQDALFEQRFADAIAHCEEANKLRPFSAEVMNIMLVCLQQTGEHRRGLVLAQEWVSKTKGKDIQALSHVVRVRVLCDVSLCVHYCEVALNDSLSASRSL
jgi:hypothetical protein